MTLKYNRRSVCMGDDINNGIYKITLSDNATLKDLIGILINGGCGNTWPIPMMSDIGWDIYSDIGKIAFISADTASISYLSYDEGTFVSSLNISWVFGEREGHDPDLSMLSKRFG